MVNTNITNVHSELGFVLFIATYVIKVCEQHGNAARSLLTCCILCWASRLSPSGTSYEHTAWEKRAQWAWHFPSLSRKGSLPSFPWSLWSPLVESYHQGDYQPYCLANVVCLSLSKPTNPRYRSPFLLIVSIVDSTIAILPLSVKHINFMFATSDEELSIMQFSV